LVDDCLAVVDYADGVKVVGVKGRRDCRVGKREGEDDADELAVQDRYIASVNFENKGAGACYCCRN
jgi:hypothetical protein